MTVLTSAAMSTYSHAQSMFLLRVWAPQVSFAPIIYRLILSTAGQIDLSE